MRKSESDKIKPLLAGENIKVILPEPFEEYVF